MDFTDLSTVNPAFSTSFTPIKREESLADSISTTSLAHSEAFFFKEVLCALPETSSSLGELSETRHGSPEHYASMAARTNPSYRDGSKKKSIAE